MAAKKKTATKKRASKKAPRKKAAPKKTAPKKTAPKKTVPKKAASRKTARKKAAPKRASRSRAPRVQTITAAEIERKSRDMARVEMGDLSSRKQSATAAAAGLGWLLAIGLGGLLWLNLKRPDLSASPAPRPPPGPTPPPLPPTTPGPTPPKLTDDQTLAKDFRRAQNKEIPRDILVQAASFLQFPMNSVHFLTAEDGRRFAFKIEEHVNPGDPNPNLRKPHKGVSTFVERKPIA